MALIPLPLSPQMTRIWGTSSYTLQMELRGHTDNVRTLALSQDGTLVREEWACLVKGGMGVSGEGRNGCVCEGGVGVTGEGGMGVFVDGRSGCV